MGANCSAVEKKSVAIPSKVIRIQVPKKHSTIHSSPTALISTATHKANDLQSRPNSQEKLSTPEYKDMYDEIKSAANIRPLPIQYDLSELGIGEYYLEKELLEMIERLPEHKKKKAKKNYIKWDRSVVHQRVKIPHISSENPLYNYNDFCLREFAINKQKSYEKMVRKGIPSRYRWSVWKNHSQIDKYYQHGLYETFRSRSSHYEHDIKKDLHRTFPNDPYFSSEKFEKVGQEHLFHVLKTVSQYFPNVGYAQSMNFIVAFLLMVSGGNEVESFWMFVTLARDPKFLMMGLFEKGFPLLEFYTFVFYEIFEEELPKLCEHIRQQMIPDPLWLFKWFLTVFLYSLPTKHAVRIWDFFMVHQLLSPIQVAIGLVKFLEEDMLKLDTFGIDLLFKHLKKDSPKTQDPNISRNHQESYEKKGTMIINHLAPSEMESPSAYQVANETSEIHYHFKEINIEEVLEYAEKVPLSLEKISYLTSQYPIKTGKKLPEIYEKFFSECRSIIYDHEKLSDYQIELDYHIIKSGLFATAIINQDAHKEILGDMLGDDINDVSVLKITHLN